MSTSKLMLRFQYLDDSNPFEVGISKPTIPVSHELDKYVPISQQIPEIHSIIQCPFKLRDIGVQLGNHGSYLDTESTISEQWETLNLESVFNNQKLILLLRTSLSAQCQFINSKLLSLSGKELGRTLISLRRVFENDEDLVQEFVSTDGLKSLISIGSICDESNQTYIIRAIGQIMLYVDGMNAVAQYTQVLEWLYNLLLSKSITVIKASLKLLILFVEYDKNNGDVVRKIILSYDSTQNRISCYCLIEILKPIAVHLFDNETIGLVLMLITKILEETSNADAFFDFSDSLESQDFENIIKNIQLIYDKDQVIMSQCRTYESLLKSLDDEASSNNSTQSNIHAATSSRRVSRNANTLRYSQSSSKLNTAADKFKRNSKSISDDRIVVNKNVESSENFVDIDDSPGQTVSLENLGEQSHKIVDGIQSTKNQMKSGIVYVIESVSSIINKFKSTAVSLNICTKENEAEVLNSKGLIVNGNDFSFLNDEDEHHSIFISKNSPVSEHVSSNYMVPPLDISMVPPPFPSDNISLHPLLPPNFNSSIVSPPPLSFNSIPPHMPSSIQDKNNTVQTMKLYWSEVKNNEVASSINKTIWKDLKPTKVDEEQIISLFQIKKASNISKKPDTDRDSKKRLAVLDSKRAQAINIALTKLPSVRSITQVLVDMDFKALGKDEIEKLAVLLPTDEEKSTLEAAVSVDRDVQLGVAEDFLLNLSRISYLCERVKLWQYSYEHLLIQQEIVESLSDLNKALDQIKTSKTLVYVLQTVLAIGNILNKSNTKIFKFEYLAKLCEVKDSVRKLSLLNHIAEIVKEKYPDSTNLFNEIFTVQSVSKIDLDYIKGLITKFGEENLKAVDNFNVLSKSFHNSKTKSNYVHMLNQASENFLIINVIHRRITNRFYKLLQYLGYSTAHSFDVKIGDFFKWLSDFALDYRTINHLIEEKMIKKAEQRARNKTRGKLITESRQFSSSKDESKINKGIALSKNQINQRNNLLEDNQLKLLLENCGKTINSPRRSQRNLSNQKSTIDPNDKIIVSNSNAVDQNETDTGCFDKTEKIVDQLIKNVSDSSSSNLGIQRKSLLNISRRKSLRRTNTRKINLTVEDLESMVENI